MPRFWKVALTGAAVVLAIVGLASITSAAPTGSGPTSSGKAKTIHVLQLTAVVTTVDVGPTLESPGDYDVIDVPLVSPANHKQVGSYIASCTFSGSILS
jgi:hypothetical protein